MSQKNSKQQPKPATQPKIEQPITVPAPQQPKYDAKFRVPTITKDGAKSRSITAGAILDGYVKGLGRTASGKPTLDVADAVADALRGLDTDAVCAKARAEIKRITGEDPGDFRAKYSKLNPGQIRMNCGNRLRAAIKADAS